MGERVRPSLTRFQAEVVIDALTVYLDSGGYITVREEREGRSAQRKIRKLLEGDRE